MKRQEQKGRTTQDVINDIDFLEWENKFPNLKKQNLNTIGRYLCQELNGIQEKSKSFPEFLHPMI